MGTQRLFAAGPLAGLATAGLFLTMNGLLADTGEVQLDERPRKPVVDYVQDPETPLVPETDWEVEEPEPAKSAPIDDIPNTDFDGGDGPYIGPIKPDRPTGPDTGLSFDVLSDGAQMPLVRVQPQYPRRAIDRGIEGYVVVSLLLEADGTVPYDSITVIEAEPAGVFDAAAKKAASKFKYKPKVVDGVAVAVAGVQYRFTFELDQ